MIYVTVWKNSLFIPIRCLPFSVNAYVRRKVISSNIQAEKICLNAIFASRFSNCKSSQVWDNIRSLVSNSTKCNTTNVDIDDLNKSFIYDPADTPIHLPPS